MRVYIGAPIDSAGEGKESHFDAIQNALFEVFGDRLMTFNPCTAFSVRKDSFDPKGCEYLVKINNTALDNADLAVFAWTDRPSFGVPYEILRRVQAGRTTFVWNRSSKPANAYLMHTLWTSGRDEDNYVGTRAKTALVNTRDELIEKLKEMVG